MELLNRKFRKFFDFKKDFGKVTETRVVMLDEFNKSREKTQGTNNE